MAPEKYEKDTSEAINYHQKGKTSTKLHVK